MRRLATAPEKVFPKETAKDSESGWEWGKE
jgi:hypothetical protein